MQFAEGKAPDWQKALEANPDPYGRAVLVFAEQWANAMEREIAAGKRLEDVAASCEREASEAAGGITGFMYGAAVSTLAQVWAHGEALRRWHNGKYAGRGGEQANANGGTINPAILTIKLE